MLHSLAVSGKASADLIQVRERDNPGGITDTSRVQTCWGRTELCVRFGQGAVHILASLNNALKPQLASILTKQRGIGVMLSELMVARDRHGDYLRWLGRLTV